MLNEESERNCCRCGKPKPATEFNFKRRAIGQRHPFCRECQHAWNREHYRRNRATYIATARRHNLEYIAANMKRIVEYLDQHPCVDCGEGDILVLHFDHRDRADKLVEVGNLIRYGSWPRIAAEIAKCDVRCANCHQRRTARQFRWRKIALSVHGVAGAEGLEPTAARFGDECSAN
jgi:hypothetical protein